MSPLFESIGFPGEWRSASYYALRTSGVRGVGIGAMSNLELMAILYPEQTILEISPKEIKEAYPAEEDYSNDVARRNAFLNRLVLNAFFHWLRTESGIDESPQVWQSEALPLILEAINGIKILLGQTQIVLIPCEDIDTEIFSVPAEWVVLPDWTADYYLAVQVNEDEGWLRVWGYATHRQLIQQGSYDEILRTYFLEREELIEDLNVMWVARQLRADKKMELAPLPTLSQVQAEALLAELGKSSLYSPRFKVDFQQWAGLIKEDSWRKQLYEKRLESVKPTLTKTIETKLPTIPATKETKNRVKLSQWLQNGVSEGWKTIEALTNTEKQFPRLALFRVDTPKLSLKEVKAGKRYDLEYQRENHRIALLITVKSEEGEKIAIGVQLYPTGEDRYLPPNLKLSLLSKTGKKIFQEVKSREKDNYIQLQNFKYDGYGKCFKIQISIDDICIIEDFEV